MARTLRVLATGVVAAVALTLSACGAGNSTNTPAAGSIQAGVDGETLAFKPTTLSAKPGAVTISFKNSSASQPHNFVLIKGGADAAQKVDEAALAAGPAAGYTPANDPSVLGSSGLVNPGAEGTVTIANLPAGEYMFICTVPGHLPAGMKGTLTVK